MIIPNLQMWKIRLRKYRLSCHVSYKPKNGKVRVITQDCLNPKLMFSPLYCER